MLSSSKRARLTSRRQKTPEAARCRSTPPLRIVTFLAPNLFWFYDFVSRYLQKKLRFPTELSVGTDYAQLAGQADMAFVCGLPYVEHTRTARPAIEPLAAPVLSGQRYLGRPIYFSDVIVRKDSQFRSFADLRGYTWAYNEPHSQSGYGIVREHLIQRGETFSYFSQVIEAGFHERAVHMVSSGEVHASAIDSHVLALLMRDNLTLAATLRIIETFGPSPIQPIVAGSHLSDSLKRDVRATLLEMADDRSARSALVKALVERFASVSDADYDEIRKMLAAAQAWEEGPLSSKDGSRARKVNAVSPLAPSEARPVVRAAQRRRM
jgi:phosphonate transport system substrate-binding protein